MKTSFQDINVVDTLAIDSRCSLYCYKLFQDTGGETLWRVWEKSGWYRIK